MIVQPLTTGATEPLVDGHTLAAALGVSERWVRRYRNRIPHERLISGQYRFQVSAVRSRMAELRGSIPGVGRPKGTAKGSYRYRNGKYCARFPVEGVEKYATFDTEVEAQKWLAAKLLGLETHEPEDNESLEKLIDRFIAAKKRRKKAGTAAFHEDHLKGKHSWTYKNRAMRARSVKRRHLQDWIDARIDEGVSAGGINADLRSIKALFRWAARDGAITINPAADLEGPEPPQDKPRKRILEPHELLALINVAKGPWKCAWMLMGLQGFRAAETARALWVHVKADEKRIHVLGKRRNEDMPMGAWVLEELAKLGKREGVLLKGRRGNLRSWQKTLNADCVAAKIDPKGISPHTLRRSLLSWLDLLQVPAGVRLGLGRHAPRGVDELYLIPPMDILAEWLERYQTVIRTATTVRTLGAVPKAAEG